MKYLFPATLIIVSLLSCKKDAVQQIPSQQQEKHLRVILHDNYLPADKIDSAIVIWRMSGSATMQKLHLTTGYLTANISSFTTGNGEIAVKIFSKHQINGMSLQFERKQILNLQNGITYTTTAPNSFDDLNWLPRIIFHQSNNGSNFNITAVIGTRPNDPVFELKEIDPVWRHRVILTRRYFHSSNTLNLLGNLTWDCNSCIDAHGNYFNNTFFNSLPQQINNRPWNTASFTLRFYKSDMEAGELNFDHVFN